MHHAHCHARQASAAEGDPGGDAAPAPARALSAPWEAGSARHGHAYGKPPAALEEAPEAEGPRPSC
eukprot:13505596-Alexandrium_andersonii.AAC.1